MADLKMRLFLNKKNGQISSYFNQKQLPKRVIDAVKKQDSTVRVLMKYKGMNK